MKLKVGHRDYTIRAMDKDVALDGPDMGYCHKTSAKIEVSPLIPAQLQAEILLHEVLHALWDTAGLPERASEEEAVSRLTRGFCALMRDNPDFTAMVFMGLTGTRLFHVPHSAPPITEAPPK